MKCPINGYELSENDDDIKDRVYYQYLDVVLILRI